MSPRRSSFLEVQDNFSDNVWSPTTWWRATRLASYNIFFGPEGASRGCYPLKGLGAKLQAVRGQSPRDHIPVMCTMTYDKAGLLGGPYSARVGWNRDLIMASLQSGKCRRDFLTAA
eukprot:2148785-Pyramimonas_sp.AAC.1